jgi:hypothetical protein
VDLQKYLVHLVLRSNPAEESNRPTFHIWAEDAEEAYQKAKDLLKRGTIPGFDYKAWDIARIEVKKGKL